jgi:uncharacterized protein (TIGR03085 family)
MASHSAAERTALADALSNAGPHLPTLCDGWTTTELAAHLVIRDRRPDAAAGILISALAGWNQRVQSRYATRPYPDLVELFRAGPPWTSPLALPGVDARANLAEHFVHCEDVRRAIPGWAPRELPADLQQALWDQLSMTGRSLLRRSPVAVTLQTPDGRSKQVLKREGEGIELIGEPGELMLYAFGRKDHSQVQIEGPDAAVNEFRRLAFNV